jgi:hypothetical protein
MDAPCGPGGGMSRVSEARYATSGTLDGNVSAESRSRATILP